MEKTTTNFTVGFKTHIGRVREMNQDSYAILRRSELLQMLDALLVVADGMGGGKGGEVASRIAAETLPNVAHEELAEVLMGRKLDIPTILKMGMERANNNVRHKGVESREMSGMGTTCVAAILNDGLLTIANAGDSRAYLLRDGALRQITEDHSQVWQEYRAGKLTREEAQKSKFRNIITKSIGLGSEVRPEIHAFPLEEGDTLLLCSDGLTTEVLDGEIAEILASSPTAQIVCDRLTEAALQKGGSDNITVVALRYGEFTPPAGVSLVTPEPRLEVEEDPTDEQADWRKPTRPTPFAEPTAFAASNGYENDEDDEDEPESDYEEPAPRSRRRKRRNPDEDEAREARSGGLAAAIIVTLLCLLAATGIALGISLMTRTIVLPPQKVIQVRNNGAGDDLNPRTGKELNYQDPTDIFGGTVRDDFLQVTEFGDVLVATLDGKIIRLTAKADAIRNDPKTIEDTYFTVGKMPEPSLPPLPPLPKSGKGDKADKTDSRKSPLLITFDASENRYQYDPATHSIFKYDQSGTRKHSDIGNGHLAAPTQMAVAPNGDIYVIDQHKIKVLQSFASNEQIRFDNERIRQGKQ